MRVAISLVLAILGTVSACALIKKEARIVESPLAANTLETETLSSLDFTTELMECDVLWQQGLDEGLFERNLWSDTAEMEALNRGAQMQLGGWITPSGNKIHLRNLFYRCWRFSQKHSRLPQNAMELLISQSSEEDSSLAKVLNLSRLDQLNHLAGLINPQTGQMYKSFDGSVSEAGAVILERLRSKEEFIEALNGGAGSTRYDLPGMDSAWKISVLDADGKTVLKSKALLAFSEKPPDGGTQKRTYTDEEIQKASEAQLRQRSEGIVIQDSAEDSRQEH